VDWASAIVDAAVVRAKWGTLTGGLNPGDPGKEGSELHVLSDAAGLPPVVAVSAADVAIGRQACMHEGGELGLI
jgi:hypothetical protein